MGLSSALLPFRSLGLLVLLVIAACAGGDRLDAPTRAAQGVGTPRWHAEDSLAATATPTRVRLTWPAPYDAEAPFTYRVYRDGELITTGSGALDAPAYTDTNVTTLGATYVYAVGAIDVDGYETETAQRLSTSVTIPGESAAPEWPTGATLTATRVGYNRVELQWDSGSDDFDEGRYEVMHRTSGGAWIHYFVVDDTGDATQRAIVADLSAAETYEFRVKLRDEEGHVASPEPATITATTLAADADFAWPSGAAATASVVTRSSLRLTWTEGPIDAVSPDGGVGLVGPVVNAATEPRRAAIFLPEGRTVTACLPGSTAETCIPQALTGELHVSLTEFTAEDGDLASMPGTLPPSSGYTYAVSYIVQEAEALHATRVEFNGPVAAYVDNFMGLHFEGLTARSGYAVPMGWYDRAAGRWVANEAAAGWNDEGSGRAIEVLGVLADGRASLDVTGDGAADEPPGLGLSDDERRWIAATYVPGTALPRAPSAPHALWRVPIAHFTAWDANMNVWPEAGAKLPSLFKIRMLQVSQPCVTCNSVIENENRAVGERVELPGVGASLHYHSGRSPSWRTQAIIPVTLEYAAADPPTPRPTLVVVHVFIEGRMYQHVVPPDPATGRVPAGVSWTFERCASDTPPEVTDCWDGKDLFGREVRGSVPMRVAVGRLREVAYTSAPNVTSMTFGADGALYLAESQGRIWRWYGGALTRIAGVGGAVPSGAPGRAPAITSAIGFIGGIAAAPDGAIFLTEPDQGRVRRIGPDGTIDTYAGNGEQSAGCSHEGGAADVDDVAARSTWLCRPTGVAVGPRGVVYLTEHFAVSRITPDGRLHRLAGRRHTGATARDCVNEFPDHGMDARNACLFSPTDVAVTPDGTVLVAMMHADGEDRTAGFQNGVFGVDPDGRLLHVAAGGAFVGSGGLLRRRIGEGWLHHARHIVVDGQGRPVVLSVGSRTVWRLEGEAPDRVPTANATVTSPDGSERYTFTRSGRILDTTDARTGRTRYTFAYDAARRLHQVTDAFSNTITIDYESPDASYIPSGVATSFTLTGPHGATATGSIGTHGWLASVDAGEWGTTTLVYDAFRNPLTAMQDNLGRWHRYVHDETGRLHYDAWAASATADLTGGRKVFLAVTSQVRDPAGLHWTSRTRDGDTLTSGLDRVDTVSIREDDGEVRTSTPPVGPGTTRTTLRGTALCSVDDWGSYPRSVPVAGSVGTGANGLFWSRSYGGGYPDSVTPLDGQTRTDVRLGSAAGSPLRLSVTTTRKVSQYERTDLWRQDVIDDRVSLVPGAEDETALATMAPVPLYHAGTRRVWWRHAERTADPWDTTTGWNVTDHTPLDRLSYTTLDAYGRALQVQGPQIAQPGDTLTLQPVNVTYDSRGRLATVTQGSRRVTYAYSDGAGYPTEVRGRLLSITVGTLAEGGPPPLVTTFAYNQDGARRVRVTAPGGIVTNSGVDPAGNVTSIVPPGRTEHAFSYGWRNMPAAYTPPIPAGGGAASAWQTTQEHEVQGMPHQVTRPDGVVDYAYTSGRLSTVTLPVPSGGGARPTLTLAYDEATGGGSGTGVLTSVTHSVNGSLAYGHDFPATGTLPTSETWSVTEGGVTTTRAVSVGYNSLAQVASWTAEGGPTVAITRDADDLVTGVGGLTITRDGPSGVELGTTMTVGESSVTTTQRYSAPYGEVASRGSTYGGGAGLSFAYGYDWFGRLKHVTESGEGSDGERWYRYDAAGRLARVCTTQDCGDAGVSTELEHYTYDANGTRAEWHNALGDFTVHPTEDVDAQDRLTRFRLAGDSGSVTFTYDNAGRTQTKVRRAEDGVAWSTTALVYDSDGALKSFTRTGDGAASVEYRNDAAGRRIARVVGGAVTARWTYQGIHPVAEYDAAWALKRVYVYATRGHVPDYVAQADGSGGWGLYRVVTDHLGSVRRVVRVSDGAVMQRMRYDAYGRVLQDETPDVGGVPSGWERIPFGYAGGLYDRTTGLVRFGARDYDAEIGRWTAKDPIGFGGGDGNLYGYVGSNPTNWIDSSGKFHPALWLLMIIIAVPIIDTMNMDMDYIWPQERRRNAAWTPPNRHGTDNDVNGNFYHCMAFCESRASDPLGGVGSNLLLFGDMIWELPNPNDGTASMCGNNIGARVGTPSACFGPCQAIFGTRYVGQMEGGTQDFRGFDPARAATVTWPEPSDPRNFDLWRGGGYWRTWFRFFSD